MINEEERGVYQHPDTAPRVAYYMIEGNVANVVFVEVWELTWDKPKWVRLERKEIYIDPKAGPSGKESKSGGGFSSISSYIGGREE